MLATALALLPLVAAAPQGGAQLLVSWDVPIVNPGFEEVSRPLAQGELTNGAGGAGVPVGTRASIYGVPDYTDPVSVPGWRTFLPTFETTIYAGVHHPPVNAQGMPFVTGHSGNHVATAHHVWIQQTLRERVQPATTYRLTFRCGSGLWEPGDGVYAALVATPDQATIARPGVPGVTTLVQTMGVIAPPGSEGQMLPWSLEVTTPAQLPPNLAGQFLAIAFVGSDGIPLMNFDDFRLRATRRMTLFGPVNWP